MIDLTFECECGRCVPGDRRPDDNDRHPDRPETIAPVMRWNEPGTLATAAHPCQITARCRLPGHENPYSSAQRVDSISMPHEAVDATGHERSASRSRCRTVTPHVPGDSAPRKSIPVSGYAAAARTVRN